MPNSNGIVKEIQFALWEELSDYEFDYNTQDDKNYYFLADTEFGVQHYKVNKETLKTYWKDAEEPESAEWEYHGIIKIKK